MKAERKPTSSSSVIYHNIFRINFAAANVFFFLVLLFVKVLICQGQWLLFASFDGFIIILPFIILRPNFPRKKVGSKKATILGIKIGCNQVQLKKKKKNI